jgi:D-alanyl-D-alanine carboxypeptidase/D-alanyl-D-alanine-endopeptidase (penicillin-binding protein 4)
MHPVRIGWRWLAVGMLLLAAVPTARAGELEEKIAALIQAPEYKGSRWGILVVDPATGQTVYSHNPDMLFGPASVTKLYSCAAALIELGADHCFETPVYRRGEVKDGRLHGDLILVAQGDPTLGGRTTPDGKLAFRDQDHIYAGWLSTQAALTDTDPLAGLKSLARQVKESGIRQVEGDVLIDDRLFAQARGSGSGPGLLTPIVVNDNIIDVTVKPGAAVGDPATFELRPVTDWAQVDVRVETVSAMRKPRIMVERTGPQRWVLTGSIPVNSKPLVRICSVDDPAGFARALFLEQLRQAGVTVKASALRPPSAELPEKGSYEKLPRVAVLKSAPLSEVIKVTLKVSHNLYASLLPLLVAVKHKQRTLEEGMKLQGKALKDLGLDVASFSLETGAGGGNGDRVTPRVTVELLSRMMNRPDFAVYREALPILAVDGTLVDVVGKDSPARGKVVGKTGTYGDADLLNDRVYLRAKSLAGYMTTAKGRTLVYAIFVNDVPLPKGIEPAREGKVIGRLCEIIYEYAP